MNILIENYKLHWYTSIWNLTNNGIGGLFMRIRKVLLTCLSILLTTSFSASVFAESTEYSTTTFSLSSVEVTNPDNLSLSENVLLDVINRAEGIASDEKASYNSSSTSFKTSSTEDVVINYYFDDDSHYYFYEETKNGKSLFVEEKDQVDNQSLTEIKPFSNDIDDGIGGRILVNSTTGNLLESKWQLPTASQLTGAPSEATYIYTGLRNSSIEVDANVTYNNASGEARFRPRLCVKPNSTKQCMGAVTQPGYDKVHSSNGYKLGSTITTAFWRSYSDEARNISKAVRLKTTGLAICANAGCSDSTDTTLINIIETNNVNMTNQQYFKLLVTIAGGEQPPGKVRATFSGITLDGVAKTPVLGATDRATVSISGNSATIIVDSTLPE